MKVEDMVSVIIPVYNEPLLNHTIENLFETATGEIEVIVALNAPQHVDKRARILSMFFEGNVGERKAMNACAKVAQGKYLFRLDAHCEMSPGWDIKLMTACRTRGIAVSTITAADKDWNTSGLYTFCKLLPNMQEKWWDRDIDGNVVETMAFTGCAWMIRKDYYDSFGGADESLPKMGAIGPEFALQAWLDGDGCVLVRDVLCKHRFDTGGYDTSEVTKARGMLRDKWGRKYVELTEKFPDYLDKNERPAETIRVEYKTVIEKVDTVEKKDNATGKVIERKRVIYKPFTHIHDGTEDEASITRRLLPTIKDVEREELLPCESK